MALNGVNGFLDVESAALRVPQVGIANTNPQHILSVGSNLYVSGDSSDVLTVDGNVVCEGVKVGLIEITPSYDLAAVSNVGNSTSNTILFTNPDTGIVATGNVSVGKTLTVDGIRITAAAEADVDLDAVVAAGPSTAHSIQLIGATDSTSPYIGTLTIGTNTGNNGGLGVAGNVHVGRGLYVDTDTLVADSTTNRVGIGKTNPDATLDVDGDAIIRGDLSVLGTTTTIDTENLRVQDPIIELGKDNTDSPLVDLGLVMTRPTGSNNVAIIFDENADKLEIGYTDNDASATDITMVSTPLSVNINGDLSVTSNLEVSGNVSDLNVVSNVNMLHTSNTASIKLNSNVVTEFPRSKKLIKYPREAIPGNNSAVGSGYTFSASDGDYTIKVSSEYDDRFYASNAFDNNLSTYAWLSADSVAGFRYTSGNPITSDSLASSTFAKFGEYGEWIELKLPTSIYLGYVLVYPKDNRVNYLNTSAIVWGSNTGNNGEWQRLSTFTSFGNYSESNPAKIVIDSLISYNYYAYQITGINSTPTNQYSVVSELEFFGVPEYDPEAHGTDVVVKSVPNVPNTDWLEVYYDAKDLATMPNTVTDLSPNTNTGAVSGHSPTLDTAGGVNSFVFDGTDDYITSTLTGLSSTQYTMAGWIKVNTLDSTVNTFFGLGDWASGDGRAIGIAITGDNVIGANVKGLADAKFSEVTTGEWYHVVADFTSGNDTHLYVNGKLVDTVAGTTFAIPTNPPLFIGSRANASGTVETARLFPGSIANFRLFNRVLTTDEIWQLYAYQKEYFGHGDLGMTLKAGRLGIGTSEPRAALDVRGGFQCGNSPLKFFVLTGVHPNPIAGQNVALPDGLVPSRLVSITGVTVNTNGDTVPFYRHDESTSWEVDVYYNIASNRFHLSSQGSGCPGKEWRMFVVTT